MFIKMLYRSSNIVRPWWWRGLGESDIIDLRPIGNSRNILIQSALIIEIRYFLVYLQFCDGLSIQTRFKAIT